MGKFRIDNIEITSDNTDAYSTEPVTVAELKTYLQIEGTAYDVPLGVFITAARQRIEQIASVSLVPKSLVVLGFLPTTYNSFSLPNGPIDTITSVQYQPACGCGDWQTLVAGTDYYEIANNLFKSNYRDYLKFTYTTSADERAIWHQAILAQAAYMYNNRDSQEKAILAPEVEMLIGSVTNTHY